MNADEVRDRYAAAAQRVLHGETRVRAADDPFGSAHYAGDDTAGAPDRDKHGMRQPDRGRRAA